MSDDDDDTELEDSSAYNAVLELHNGRIEWLAEHIRRSNFQIHELVARKILAMIERTEQDCACGITRKRRTGLPPSPANAHPRPDRGPEVALPVGPKCGFKRGHVQRACAEVSKEWSKNADRSGLTPEYIEKCARRYKSIALDIIAEEEAQKTYERGETDFLSRPIYPEMPFASAGGDE